MVEKVLEESMMNVRDVMTTDVQTVSPALSLADFERQVIASRVSGFPVVDDGNLVGVVTRSDVVRTLTVERTNDQQLSDFYGVGPADVDADVRDSIREVGARIGARTETMCVKDVMSKYVLNTEPGQSLQEIARLMVDRKIHRLPVVEDGKLVGIVSTLDLVALVAEGQLVET
jgi:CBS domain-containing protein